MFGNIMNAVAIMVGGLVGVMMKGRVSARFESQVIKAVALGVLILGISGALLVRNPLLMLIALASGAVLGEWWNVEGALERLTERIKSRLNIKGEGFTAGFVSSTLLFCVGSMAIVGSLDSGLYGDHSVLLAKGVIDGIVSVLMASTMGIGVMFSSISVFLYQGTIVLLASILAPYLTEVWISDVSTVGSVLIMAIALRMMGILDVKVGNLLPAILMAGILSFTGLF